MRYLYLLQQALIWIITVYWLYQLVVSFCSLIKLKDKPLKINKDHKFMAVIPAHNEEAVVGNLVESLKAQNYPKDKYDMYSLICGKQVWSHGPRWRPGPLSGSVNPTCLLPCPSMHSEAACVGCLPGWTVPRDPDLSAYL